MVLLIYVFIGTEAFCKLEKALTNKRILRDVEKMSPHHQTSSLEAFHSVILRFAPKNVVFPFLGMLCRYIQHHCCHTEINPIHTLYYRVTRSYFWVLFFFLRLYLAAMHFNENAGHPQATSSTGELLYRLNFPKSKKGECSVKPVKVDPMFRKFCKLLL